MSMLRASWFLLIPGEKWNDDRVEAVWVCFHLQHSKTYHDSFPQVRHLNKGTRRNLFGWGVVGHLSSRSEAIDGVVVCLS